MAVGPVSPCKGPPSDARCSDCETPYCSSENSWECRPKDSSASCDDGNPCTFNDHCDGKGACSPGTPITCTSTACETRTCDGTPACAVANAPTSTPCGDGSTCSAGFHCDGNGACLTPSVCRQPYIGTVTCSNGTCALTTCPAGTFLCPAFNACVPSGSCCNDSDCPAPPAHGAPLCSEIIRRCPPPQPGEVVQYCDSYGGSNCSATCASDFKPCDGACIPSNTCCDSSQCPTMENATALCTGGDCSLTCNPEFRLCNGACLSNKLCCADADCSAQANATPPACIAQRCSYSCLASFQPCGDSCISNQACCNPE